MGLGQVKWSCLSENSNSTHISVFLPIRGSYPGCTRTDLTATVKSFLKWAILTPLAAVCRSDSTVYMVFTQHICVPSCYAPSSKRLHSSCKDCVTLGSLRSGVGNSPASLPSSAFLQGNRFLWFYGVPKGDRRKLPLLHDSHLSVSYSGMIMVG